MPSISAITSFRDRDSTRVGRFLESLNQQTDKDFELIFLDYGSQEKVASEIEELCGRYPFCRYVYNDARGMYWNRSHAMNSAAMLSESDYLFFTDIDLIFATNVIERLRWKLSIDKQLFCRAYYLPRQFSDYPSLTTRPTHFKRTTLKTKGLFHCVSREAFLQAGSFDEYYCIWGVEDTDLAMRIRALGPEIVWLDTAEAPIYHQWHPSSARLAGNFPTKWWENMAIHTALKENGISSPEPATGRLLQPSDRPSLHDEVTTRILLAPQIEPPGRARAIRDIVFFLINYPGKVLEVRVKHPARASLRPRHQTRHKMLRGVINTSNRLFKRLRLPVQLMHERYLRTVHEYTHFPDQKINTPESMQYVIQRLIKDSDIISDYAITAGDNWTSYRLVGRSS